MRETWGRSLGWEDPLEKGKATHSSILAWRTPWTGEPGGLQSTGPQRVSRVQATQAKGWQTHTRKESGPVRRAAAADCGAETGPSGGHSHPERLRATQHTRRTRDAGTSRTERETTVTAGDSNTSLSARTELLKSNASNHTALNTAFSRLSSQHTQKAPSSPCSPRHPRVTHRHTPEARTPRQPMFWVTEQTPANSQELKPSTLHPLTVMESQKSRTES